MPRVGPSIGFVGALCLGLSNVTDYVGWLGVDLGSVVFCFHYGVSFAFWLCRLFFLVCYVSGCCSECVFCVGGLLLVLWFGVVLVGCLLFFGAVFAVM